MYSFKNDYSEGAHPNLLNILVQTNLIQEEGYGYDSFYQQAISKIKEKMKRDDVDIHLISGGTQTNLIAISAFLKPHQAVISAETGHIFVNECGAIEATGHKVITVEGIDGKLNPELIEAQLKRHKDEHTVKPKLVYISNPTEIGTIYKKEELEQLSAFCKENKLIFYVDGARLGSALCSLENDVTLGDMSHLVDAFYIGGTKNGALLGEALVICRDDLKEDFRYHMKQKGALMAKSRLLGTQFLGLFEDDLFFELATHANNMAKLIKEGLTDAGCEFLTDSTTNQLFPILSNDMIEKLQEKYNFYIWNNVDESYSAIRLITSWATKEEMAHKFVADVKALKKELVYAQ